ncbi:glycosyltransferase [Herbivorax sp. ANBcel31]|uniref:MGDG synthase family glycosyltransferase n=1 Tax=Herbivorax sp. ANBcel31 TaxID=3069754 RepID=UPI0027AFFBD3|nr:glycosyltransferase [Herbivorax sp. ANBcel31]MDQ2086053.1 glycosyltransferase [Herbivorax sp. ANBcel31]
MDVLFLSISMGAGHLKAAYALKEYIEKKYPHSKNMVVDTFKYVNPLAHKLIVDGYLKTIKLNPKLYGKLYNLSEYKKGLSKVSHFISVMLSYKIEKLVKEFKPSVIVCTHPFPLQMVSYLKKENKIFTPTIAVLTDYVNHPLWFHKNIEAFIVGHEYIKQDMIRCGIPRETIFSYGVPVSQIFLNKKKKTVAKSELSLDDKFTLLIMGGSLGYGDLESTFINFAKSFREVQLIVVCGKNKKLKKKLENISYAFNKNIKVYGYTDNISKLMDASDVVVTKPGGMTISEALIKELPMFIISPIPGQEERNAKFLVTSGAAIIISKNDDVENILCQTLDNWLRFEHMKKMAKNLSMPHSGESILKLMEDLAYKFTIN